GRACTSLVGGCGAGPRDEHGRRADRPDGRAAMEGGRMVAKAERSGVEAAQRGVAMAAALAAARSGGDAGAGAAGGPADPDALRGPFLAPGSLTVDERLVLIAGVETVLEGVYTH